MAWVSTTKLIDHTASDDEVSKAAVNNYQVIFDDAGDGAYSALFAPDVPRVGQWYDVDGRLTVKTRSAAPDEKESKVFIVTINYGFDEPGSGVADSGIPTLRFASVQRQVAKKEDANGTPYIASNGQPFDPPPMIDESFMTMTLTATVDEYNPGDFQSFMDTVNSERLLGVFDEGQCKLIDYGASTKPEGNKVRFEVSLTWHIDDDWILNILDTGTYQTSQKAVQGVSGDPTQGVTVKIVGRRKILDADGVEINEPVLLDGNGKPLVDGVPVFLPFTPYPPANHTTMLRELELPITFDAYTIIN